MIILNKIFSDFDPRIVEQHEDGKVDALPLSYVLKYNQGPTNNFCELKYNVKEKYKYAKSTLNGNFLCCFNAYVEICVI